MDIDQSELIRSKFSYIISFWIRQGWTLDELKKLELSLKSKFLLTKLHNEFFISYNNF